MKSTLKNRQDYRAAYKGKRTHSSSLTVIVGKNEDARYGIITSKSTGNAVQRHTLQRITREALRGVELKNSVLIVYNAGSGSISKRDIRTELEQALRKAKVK